MPTEAKVITLCAIFGLYLLYQRFHEWSPEETRPECKDTLQLYVSAQYDKSFEFSNGKNNVNFSFNRYVDVRCEGKDQNRLFLKKDGKLLYVTSFTDYLLREHTEFICHDKETKCEVSVLISVTPVFGTINSETIDEFRGNYIMQYPKDSRFLLFCTGAASSSLSLTKEGMRLRTRSRNSYHQDESGIVWSEAPADVKFSEYICTDSKTTLATKATIRFVPDMYVHSQGNLIRPLYDYNRDKHEERYRVGYNNFIEVFCTWPRAANLIGLGQDEHLASEFANINTLKISKTINEDSKFGCADSDSDYMRYVQIEVIPRMYVHLHGEFINPLRVEMSWSSEVPRMIYRVNDGDSIEVFCSWSGAVQLVSNLDIGKDLIPEIVNTDTVKLRKEIKETSVFGCAESDSKYMKVYVEITVDEPNQTDGQVKQVKAEL